MAQVIFAAATSRSPLLSMSAGLWSVAGERDKSSRRLRTGAGEVLSYEQLLAKAPPLEHELTAKAWQTKSDAGYKALGTIAEKLTRIRPDILVMMGDDEDEYIHEENRPAFMIYRGPSFLNIPRSISASSDTVTRATSWTWGEEERSYAVASDLGLHVVKYLAAAEFDVSDSVKLPAMGHGFGFVYRRVAPQYPVPTLPIIINVDRPPNQPTPKRCYDFGRAVRDAITAWDSPAKVAVVATGGLSVGIIEEELDRRALAAMQNKDVAAIAALPRPWMEGATGEVRSWLAAAGCAEHLKMNLLDYIPAYRTPAGTGAGLAFAYWE